MIVALGAPHATFRYFVVERHGELRSHLAMTREAQLGRLLAQQRFPLFRMMGGMAGHARDGVGIVLAPTKIVALLLALMAFQTDIGYLGRAGAGQAENF